MVPPLRQDSSGRAEPIEGGSPAGVFREEVGGRARGAPGRISDQRECEKALKARALVWLLRRQFQSRW